MSEKLPAPKRGTTAAETEATLIRQALQPKKAAVLAKLSELAAAGDPRSMDLYLKYIAPPARPEDERITVPGLAESSTLEEKAQAVVRAVASGSISAAAGATTLALLEKYARLVVADDHERRLRAIEAGRALLTRPADVVDVEDETAGGLL